MHTDLDIDQITYGNEARLPGSESDLQKVCAEYLDYLKVLYFHPPNGGLRNLKEAARFKAEGVKPGVSDLVILEPRADRHGLMVELKVGKNTLSDYQVEYLRACWRRGYAVAVCYTFDAFKAVVDRYLKNAAI